MKLQIKLAMNKGGTLTYLHRDHLGSASVATDGGGNIIANSELAYKPFGRCWAAAQD
ncbi:MAG: hypothetical protein KIH69_012810 [Anaerolineae bacterium]|nr:hypothetical protein [Anaerolineae bacterium]